MTEEFGYESAWPQPAQLDVQQLLANGSLEGPYVRPHPITRSFRCRLGRFWRALWAFLTDTKGPRL